MKKNNLVRIIALCGIIISFIPNIQVNAANNSKNSKRYIECKWIKDKGLWTYKKEDGSLAKGWIKVKDKWYHMDRKGIMETGWVKVKDKWYYMDKDGEMRTGWVKVKDKWYYMDDDGEMETGWTKVKGRWYYMDKSGAMETGWVKVKNKWYHMDNSGEMETGWINLKNKKYYLRSSGEMVTGKVNINKNIYYFNNDGSMKEPKWVKNNGNWYYKNSDDSFAKGWIKVKDKWYYMNKDGEMKTGWLKLGDKWYYMDEDGEMRTGWVKVKNRWYHMDKSGEMETGWIKVKDKWYYMDKSGSMVTGRINIGTKSYEFYSDGSMKDQEFAKGKLTNFEMNLRSKPSLNSAVLTTVPEGSDVLVLEKVKGDLTYYRVKYNHNGKTYNGYISTYLNGVTAVQVCDDNNNNEFLGVLSEKYESNGNSGCISSGEGDYGGKSYGAWQLSSKLGSLNGFVNWLKGENYDFYKRLTDARSLDNGSNCGPHFDKEWKNLANNHYNTFYNLQHKYTKKTFYDDLVNRLTTNDGFSNMLTNFSIRNVLWSTAVQHGAYGAYQIIAPLSDTKDVEKFINKVYAERGRKNSSGGLVHFPNCSKAVQRGVASRFSREENDAIRMYEYSF